MSLYFRVHVDSLATVLRLTQGWVKAAVHGATIIYSGVMNIFLALLPCTIIPQLQIKMKEKIGVAIGMSMGVFAGVTAFVKSAKLRSLGSEDFTFEGGDLVTWGTAETATTVIAISIPVLRALVRRWTVSTARFQKSTSQDGTPGRLHLSGKKTNDTSDAQSAAREGRSDTASDQSLLPKQEDDTTRSAEVTMTNDRRLGDI
ncbi:hypothetical protein BJ170DRAFT_731208 [Xylariales sp. AK1849]|nr:hypothetical protein BJ170DRAFT_731208 [Xylariales sp. AK1849]